MADDKLRDFEAAVKMVMESRGSIDTVRPHLDQLVQSIGSDDIVFQVNCIQLLADLASSNDGMAYVESKNVPNALIEMIRTDNNLIVPHVLKFFCRVHPQTLDSKYPGVLEKMYEFFHTDDQSLLINAIDFLGVLGRTGYNTRKMLDQHSPLFKENCLARLGRILQCADGLVKTRALQCIIDLLELHDEYQEESQELGRCWYLLIIPGKGRMTSQLLSLCRQPFQEIRLYALLLAAVIASQPWGQQELADDTTFLPWLLDRSTEVSKEGKEAKFDILQTLVKSSTASKVFGGENYMKMRADFKNGPFHVGIAEEMLVDQQAG